MTAACVICLGESGKQLSGKRCTAAACKAEYSRRLAEAKRARTGGGDAGVNARALADFIGDCRARRLGRELRALGAALYGRRDYDPDQFSSYELRNGVAPDRVKQRAVLTFAHYKENEADMGKSVHGWIELEELLRALPAEKLSVLDHFMENNPNAEWEREVERLRAQMADRDGEV